MRTILNQLLMLPVLVLLGAFVSAGGTHGQDRNLLGTMKLYDALKQTFRNYYPKLDSAKTDP